ncbi:MAG: beta-ketoacyl synthase N-terminal-like domain-containing protein [Pseudomonadota bacterium]
MDTSLRSPFDDSLATSGEPLAVTGLGHVICPADAPPCDPTPYLRQRKLRKFMGAQDDLAVVAAGATLASAELSGRPLGERVGLYIVVGYIPFEEKHLSGIVTASTENGSFSMARFSVDGLEATNPIHAFRCLPNMPAFHVSVSFDIQGPYLVTYPGPAQLYLALESAALALETGTIDCALVGGVAHQQNLLVQHHYGRIAHPMAPARLADAAAFFVLEREETAAARRAPRHGRLLSWSVDYRRHDPFHEAFSPCETFEMPRRGATACPSADDSQNDSQNDCTSFNAPPPLSASIVPEGLGPASLPAYLSMAVGRTPLLEHSLCSRDGITASSRWEVA